MNNTRRLTETQVGVLFHINGHPAGAQLSDSESDAVYQAGKSAFEAIDAKLSSLPSARFNTSGPDDFEGDAYELCEFGGELEDFNGKLVTGVWVASSRDFTPQAVSELKALCQQEFDAAAGNTSVTCTYAGLRSYSKYEYTESLVMEVA